MAWFQSNRKVQLPVQAQVQIQTQTETETETPPVLDDNERVAHDDENAESLKLKPTDSNVTEDQNRDPFVGVKVTEDQNRDPFMGVKVRRKASFHRDYIGDYLDVPSRPYLMKILEKQDA
ncbi:hypothetical protein HAX54_050185 [Datura stramonium]|uniref:Uncharacterized protein n=1 Tax=Datura stramonium TaxID=4076 RepID=A0ABS8WQ06_DATST|nr:hypothetical protein [Datura stramonium]